DLINNHVSVQGLLRQIVSLLKNLRSRRPSSVEVLSLLTKPSRREVDLPIRYVGFEVPDVFVVGYGLDFAEHYRGLSDIVTLRPDAYGG
ncbi:MAG: hypothetical protein R6U94_08735, partial [Nitriliruptoraceae bacterium]